MADSAGSLKQVTMELGGKSPLIIFADTSVDQAVSGAMLANFYTQGEVCTHGTRVFVERPLYQAFLDELAQRTQSLIIGDPTDPATQIGALISANHLDKVMGYIERAKTEGARLICGGYRLDRPGYFVAPTVFADCTDEMELVHDEVFGPVMAVMPFDNEAEALQRANNTPFGLAGGVFTRDISRATRVTDQLKAGICWINTWGNSPAEMPVGGYKLSGWDVKTASRRCTPIPKPRACSLRTPRSSGLIDG